MAFGMWSWWCINPGSEKVENLTAIITSLVAVFAAICWLLQNAKKSRKAIAPLPPGPRGLPLIGYLPFIGSRLHMTFTELAAVYGPIFKFWLGKKLCVVVSSPSLAKEVVRDQDTIFANRDPPIAALLATSGGNDIAWSPYGPSWRKMRKLFVGKMMSNASLDACYALRKEELKNTIRDVYGNKIGKPVDIGELSISTSSNVIQKVLWGSTLQGENGASVKLRGMIEELMVLLAAPNISDIFPVLSMFDIQGIQRRTTKVSLWFETIITSAIEEHTKVAAVKEGGEKNNDQKDFLQFLLELKDHEDSATSITMTQLKALLMDIIVAGTDTTTTMVEWAMVELMMHPEVMKNVHEELAEVVGMDSCVEEFHLPKLRYLDAVVKEALRLHPAVPLLVPRCSSQTSTIGGYTIPKGTRVMLNVWAIHRDPQLWENPCEFQPERFLNEPGKFDYLGNNFQYMPFGSGRRMCAGIPLAERMLMFVLASLLHSFEWKLPEDTELDLSDRFSIVLKKMKPLVAIPTARLSNSELYN